ncbi:type 4a pilus biogenesis protein PilO [Orenia marismortui]|uniref:Tfp pilus assembly protein PilO n=1 Tax=Orenia marismortui TaxID=46469 RepID=A0A4R8GIA9_9FIRM|nr:type 4a pilus biogenesis protein PilO [Orenia marismortui]TDX45406.1 Tfp pilus assembly protein PilO [Orenia marismortui]
MIELNQTKLSVIIPLIIFFLLSFSLYFFNISPTRNKVEILKEEIINRKLKINKVNDFILKSKDNDLVNKVIEENKKINSQIPLKSNTNQFLREIEKKIMKNNINLDNFYTQGSVKKDEYIQISIRLLFSGSYKDIINFFKDLESLERLYNIASLAITKNDKQELEIETLLHIYSFNQGGGSSSGHIK